MNYIYDRNYDSPERWRTVKGFPEYQVGDKGHVRNIRTRRVLKPYQDEYGYLRVVLYTGNRVRKQKFMVARLVMEAFASEGLDDGDGCWRRPGFDREVTYLDGNRGNVALENLKWCSHSEAMTSSYQRGRVSLGSRPNRRVKIIELNMEFPSVRSCADYLDISRAMIDRHLRGTLETVKGYHIIQLN